ncbi:DUF3089 domain-containing protein [Brevundimonas sp. A19_0]|uniref:DUF3089 domain-containing protein n=1 Tax=Brevundimonas sp. A19_0 TaxID=2821087 RepID=UPI001ADB1DD3|nr:DUF3089 domain-containing protein [Brevundimonas sp. A19_0]MBO9500736.1 DUF3089 domain-containing protein [Brevundimonas sp. A19_0]
MSRRAISFRSLLGYAGFALVFLIVAAAAVWRGDILQAGMDPEVPFQTYDPPPAPDYGQASAWAMQDVGIEGSGPAAVFFIHSTTYDGGREWNGPIGEVDADDWLFRVVIPNYAGPFARAGRLSIPRYRQGSLYTRLTLRDDAREARAFAWRDIDAAFDVFLAQHPTGPIVIAGLEQGGELADRLVRERIVSDPALRRRVVAVYIMDAVVAKAPETPSLPPCQSREQLGCVVAFSPVGQDNDGAARRRLRRALVWDVRGRLADLGDRDALCVNPVTGSTDEAEVPARLHRGATNATGLEWGARPALIARSVETECRDGLLRHSEPSMESFRESGNWSDRRKSRPYNLFYGDIEHDVQERLALWLRLNGQGSARDQSPEGREARQSNSASST